MAKEQSNPATLIGAFVLIAVLCIGLGSLAFPQTEIVYQDKEVPVEVEVEKIVNAPFNYEELLAQCPDKECVATESTTEIIEFTPIDELESSWLFVIDNWKDGDDYTTSGDDFEDILELCGGDDYDLDEIEFDIEDEFKYLVKDFDKNKYTLVFWLDAEYDNECENEIKVTVDYYRSRDPVYTFLIR